MSTFSYRADHYTGANVSIMIGDLLLAQAFGISWQVQQVKRPIYGYNSQYFDAVSDGTVIISGQLFVNFVSPNYLPEVLRQYWQFRNLVQSADRNGRLEGLVERLGSSERTAPLLAVIRDTLDPPLRFRNRDGSFGSSRAFPLEMESQVFADLYDNTDRRLPEGDRRLDSQRMNLNMSPGERHRALDVALDAIFTNEDLRADLITTLTGSVNVGSFVEVNRDGQFMSDTIFGGDRYQSIIERNMPGSLAGDSSAVFARPDQFGSAGDHMDGIDILVTFGPPYNSGDRSAQIYNYQKRESFLLKGVRFLGEAGEVMADDRPVMESYSFLARKKESIPTIESRS